MNTEILIPTLAKKYGIDISTDEGVMDLFNSLCVSMDNKLIIERQAAEIVRLHNEMTPLKIKLKSLKDSFLGLLTGSLPDTVKSVIKKVYEKPAANQPPS